MSGNLCGDSIVRRNLMERADYRPYCGGDYAVCGLPRLRWDGEQFTCVVCKYRTNFPNAFIAEYRAKWDIPAPRTAKDRDWSAYPLGTKAHAFNGGCWLRTEHGWTWNGHLPFPGSTFPTPGADAFGKCIELPAGAST